MSIYELNLNQTILLQELTPDVIQLYLNDGRFRLASYNENAVIHFEGEPCMTLEIIISGEIAVERLDESGGLLTIAKFFKDDILGGNLLFSNNARYPMTVSTKKTSVILGIEKELLFELFLKYPSFLRLYLEYVSDHTIILGYKINL